jgi:hypothetical protein
VYTRIDCLSRRPISFVTCHEVSCHAGKLTVACDVQPSSLGRVLVLHESHSCAQVTVSVGRRALVPSCMEGAVT